MLLNEGWFSKGVKIPEEMISSYLNDYLVYNYMRLYGIFNNDDLNNYKHLLRDLYTLNTFKELDKQVNEFVNKKDKHMPKENTISVLNRICYKFGLPNEILNNAVKDFKENELNKVNEASIEKNPYPAGSLQANLWRPTEDNTSEENEDWMVLWKQHNQQEASDKWIVIHNRDGSWSLKKGSTIDYNFDSDEKDEAEEKAKELNKELSESILVKKDESLSKYLNRMKNLFIDN